MLIYNCLHYLSLVASRKYSDELENEEDCSLHTNMRIPTSVYTAPETTELVNWIDKMSEIGSLCIKHTFLKEINAKQKQNLVLSSAAKFREALAPEKRWLDFIKRNSDKFACKFSCGLSENDYLYRWFDTDYWRMSYYNYVKQECKISTPDALWTCDVIHFPYGTATGMLKAPEKDYQSRPRNLKPRISVIFAFSASGDYLSPFVVYPDTFKQTEASENANDSSSVADTVKKSEETNEGLGKFKNIMLVKKMN